MIRVLQQETKSIVSAATIVAALSLLSRLIGFVRDRILAGVFGAGDTLDAYYAAFLIPDLLFNLLVIGALSASFIPLFTSYYCDKEKRQKAWELTSNVTNILAVVFIAISLIGIIFALPIAKLIAPGFGLFKQEMVADFMRIMFLSNFILAISVVFGAVLQGVKKFLLYSLAPILYNIGIIFGIFAFVPALGELGLAVGVVFGAILHMILQFVGVRASGYRHKWIFNPKSKDVIEIAKLMLPRTLGVAVNQVNVIAMTMIATTLAVGSVTIFQFAYNIQFLPIGVLAISYAIAAFPTLSELASKDEIGAFKLTLTKTARQILFFLVPASILFLLVRAQIVRVVVGAGEFGWAETIATADTLAFFTLSFFAQGLVYLFARAFFSLKDTISPFIAALIAGILNVIAGLYFTGQFGVIGLGIGFSLSAVVQIALLWVLLRQKIGSLYESKMVSSIFIISIAAIGQGVVTQLLKPLFSSFLNIDSFIGVFLQGFLAGGFGLVVYLILAWLFKSPEMHDFAASMNRRLFKRFRVSEIVSEK